MLCVRKKSFPICLLHWGAGVEDTNSTFNLPISCKSSVSRTIKLKNMSYEKNSVTGSPVMYYGYC